MVPMPNNVPQIIFSADVYNNVHLINRPFSLILATSASYCISLFLIWTKCAVHPTNRIATTNLWSDTIKVNFPFSACSYYTVLIYRYLVVVGNVVWYCSLVSWIGAKILCFFNKYIILSVDVALLVIALLAQHKITL